jgi:Carbohydrate-selective porin, OprB family/S-layer homology domain
MNHRFWLSGLTASAFLGVGACATSAIAAEPPANLPATFSSILTDVNSTTEAGQVTSVSQLSDVQPTDWAFQALQSLVERYGCIAGYPDGTFRGNRAATRYELAAALNACLDQISDRFATKEDLAAVKALQEEFKTELATLKGRVDGLEARTKTLESQQFSTTTKLTGEAIFAVGSVFSSDRDVQRGTPAGVNAQEIDSRVTFSDRLRLNFDTSFTGKDRLRIRLQARNIQPLNAGITGTNATRLSFDGVAGDNNTFTLDDLYYRFPVGKNGRLTVIANSGDFYTSVNTFNPFLENDGTGTISRFGRFNPIYRFSDRANSAGAVFNYKFSPQISASVGYLADGPQNAVGPTGGLFGGSYSALAQLEFQPTKNIGLGLTYVHAFQETGFVAQAGGLGSSFANSPFTGNLVGNTGPASSNSVGVQATAKVAPWLNLSGWGGFTRADEEAGPRSVDIINWAVAAAFPDLFVKGNLGAIIVGQQPRVIGRSNFAALDLTDANKRDRDGNFHIEALYRFNVNNNISITPGLIVIVNPENNSRNDIDFVPVIRTTFKF